MSSVTGVLTLLLTSVRALRAPKHGSHETIYRSTSPSDMARSPLVSRASRVELHQIKSAAGLSGIELADIFHREL